MRKREIVLDLISKLLWCIFIPSVILIQNHFIRAIAVLVGISLIISIIELGRYILTDEAPFLSCLQKIISTKDKREKLLYIAELAVIPITTSIILLIMISLLTRFFILIGA